MRFLFFSAQYPPTVGGVERYTHSLAHTLAGMGHGATVVTSALPGLPRTEDMDGVRVVRLPSHLLMGGRLPVVKHGPALRRAAAPIWAQAYDFAVIQTRLYPLSVWAAGQCRRRGVPALVLEHGAGHLVLSGALLSALGRLYEHAAARAVRRRCPRFYGVSQACGRWLGHFGIGSEGVLYNAVDVAGAEAAAAGAAVRARLGIAPAAPLVAFGGRLIREKGVFELLDAFAAVRRELPGAALVMAGGGPELPAVRARAGPGVCCPGPLPHPELLALMACSDVFCLPTSYPEGFPTTVLEAAALGRCVVATAAGGGELVADGETGLLLADTRSATVAAALLRALRNPALRAGLGRAARARVQERFTWPATARALLSIAQKDV